MERTEDVGISFSVSEPMIKAFPDLLVGAFRVDGLACAAAGLDTEKLQAVAAEALEGRVAGLPTVTDEPSLAAWRRAIGACGLKPSNFRSSPEQLARRLLKGASISTPLPVVNAYCALSAQHLAPLGMYDTARLPSGTIELRFATAADRFRPLGGTPEEFPLHDRVPVYAVDAEVLCWGFNCRDSAATCLVDESDTALVVGEAVAKEQKEGLLAALDELADVLESAGATVGQRRYFDAGAPSGEVDIRPG